MKKTFLFTSVYPFFFLLTFIAACKGQPTNIESTALSTKGEQLAEYVVEVNEDSKGNLWFGTMAKGAARYDGKKLTYFSKENGLIDNTVASIVEDHAGNIWFGTHNGASKYDGKTFTNYGEAAGLHGMGCYILVTRNGDIWAGTNHGVFRFDGTSFHPFELPVPVIENPSHKWETGKIWSLIEDRQGNLWFGRDGYGACKYDGTSFIHFTKKDGLCSNNVSQIVEDLEGNIWFGSLSSDFPTYKNEGGLSRYDGSTFSKFPEMEGLTESDIYTIYVDKSGNIWIGAIGVGLYRYDGEQFTLFNETDRMDLTKNFALQGIVEDRKGTLWLGFSGGLFRFTDAAILNVTQEGPWK